MAAEELKNLIEMGTRLAQAGRLVEARAYFSQQVKADPSSAAAWYLLGAVMDDPEKKRYCFDRAASIDPDIVQKIKAAARPATKAPVPSPAEPLSEPRTEPTIEREFETAPGSESILIPAAEAPAETGEAAVEPRKKRMPLFYVLAALLGLVFLLLVGAVLYLVLGGAVRPAPLFPTPVPAAGAADPNRPLSPTATPSNPVNVLQLPPRVRPPAPGESTGAAADPARLEEDFNRAILDNYKNDYAGAITLLDGILAAAPGYADAWYERGKAYYWKAGSLQNQEEYRAALTQAVGDYDRAIEIDPLAGDFYIRRAHALHDLALDAEFSTERQPLAAAAMENMRRGMELGSSIEYNDFNLAWIANTMGDCQAALDVSRRELQAGPGALADEVYSNRAASYLCLGQYPAALDEINRAVAAKPDSIGYMFQKAKILYSLGEQEQALVILNQLIKQQSNYWGYRYYLRALILFDRGEFDQARQDMEMGYANTFWHGDIYMYLKARLALLDGDRAAAVFLMQQAEASLLEDESPAIAERIRRGLKDLGAAESKPLYYPRVNPTPIAAAAAPADPSQYPPHADSGLLPPGAAQAVNVSYTAGTGRRALLPGSHTLFHFKTLAPIPVRRATRLTIRWTPQADSRAALEVSLWSRTGEWRAYPLSGPETIVEQPAFFVGKEGDLYVLVRNTDPTLAAAVENIGVEVELITTDGRVVKMTLE